MFDETKSTSLNISKFHTTKTKAFKNYDEKKVERQDRLKMIE